MNVRHRDTFRLGFDESAAVARSCWPTTTQRLLLQACLGGPELARAAFKAWHARVDVFKLDHGSNRLMALLYRNLERAGVKAPEQEILKGNWRYHWYINKGRLREFAAVQALLAKAGIPVVAMKGVPLAAFYYEDLGARPMADFDLLVRREHGAAAVQVLEAAGYRLNFPFKPEHLEHHNGRTFFKQGATEIDLHWRVLHDIKNPWSDDEFLAGATSRVFEGTPIRFLRAEDQVIHLCSHGMRHAPISPLRWLADVAVVMRREGDRMDMDYLWDAARRRELVTPVKLTLAWLERHLDLSCAPALRRTARTARASWGERIDYVWRAYPPVGLPGLVPLWIEHWRAKSDTPTGKQLWAFLRFYAKRNKLDGRAAAAAHIALMLGKRVAPWAARRWTAWLDEQWNESLAYGHDDGLRRVIV